MPKQPLPTPPREWRVFVHSAAVGDIGSVMESNETLARCAALSRFARDGERNAQADRVIFDSDDFDVRPSR